MTRWYDQGLGSGRGEHYKPWFNVRDFGSHGRSHMPPLFLPGFSERRIVQLVSDLEFFYYLHVLYSGRIVDLREQFPLPRDRTLHIAKKYGLKHPVYPRSSTPRVITTDFVLTVRTRDGTRELARTAKYQDHFQGERTQHEFDDLEIERRYWVDEKIDWKIVTEVGFTEVYVDNLKTLEWSVRGGAPAVSESQRVTIVRDLQNIASRGKNLSEAVELIVRNIARPEQEVKRSIYYLGWTRVVDFDLSVPLAWNAPFKFLKDTR